MITEHPDSLVIKEFRRESVQMKLLVVLPLALLFWWLMKSYPDMSMHYRILIFMAFCFSGWGMDLNCFDKLVFERESATARLTGRSLRGSRLLGEMAFSVMEWMVLVEQVSGKEVGRLRMYLQDGAGNKMEIPLLRKADRLDADKLYATLSRWLHGSGYHCLGQKVEDAQDIPVQECTQLLMLWKVEPVNTPS